MVVLKSAAGSSRAATLRIRVRSATKNCDWMHAVTGDSCPRQAKDFVDCLNDFAQNLPRKTLPGTMLASLSFLEERGDVPFQDRVSEQGSVKRAVQYLTTEIDRGSNPVKKAPPYFLVMVLALELGVSDVTAPTFSRAI
eukprot:10162509-Karenia_brevis.AAC.1